MTTRPYLGKHTSIAYLSDEHKQNIPYLKDNNGMLPPLIIAVGDGRRTRLATRVLGLENVVKLHEEGEKCIGLKGHGRNQIVLGTFENFGKTPVPLMIVETQMGMPATEIILREVCSHCSTKYKHNGEEFMTSGIYVIRVGTAGGINDPNDTGQTINVGNLINASFSIGWSGALLESMGGLDYGAPEVIQNYIEQWVAAGFKFTKDGKYPMGENHKKLITTINKAASETGTLCFTGGNFSKDSLYAEIDETAFIKLRKDYGVMSTEMEQMALIKVAHDLKGHNINVYTGLISGVIGVIPGESFGTTEDEETAVETIALKTAARALAILAT